MSIWIYPKTDWHPTMEEGVKGDDFNRIEKDLDFLYFHHRFFPVMIGNISNIAGSQYSQYIPFNTDLIIQKLTVKLPPLGFLNLHNARWGGLVTGLSLRLYASDWSLQSQRYETDALDKDTGFYPDFDPIGLTSNTSGIESVDKNLILEIRNTTGNAIEAPPCSWAFNMSISLPSGVDV